MSVRTAVADLAAFRRDPLVFLTRCARERGDRADLRLGPYRALLLSHPELVAEMLVARARSLRKSPVLRAARVVLGDGLLTSEGELHRRQRRLVQPAFAPGRLDTYATTMATVAEAEALRLTPGRSVDVHAVMLRLTLAAAARALFGRDISAHATTVEHALDDLLAAYGSPLLPVARVAQWLPLPAFRRLRRGRAGLDAVVAEVIASRTGGEHLLGALAATDMGPRQLRDEVVTLLLAGHETTASMLAWTCWLLAGDPDARTALEAEADGLAERLGQRTPHRDDLALLPVARGALAEALRLYPPSWAMGRQVAQELTLGQRPVRRGTVLIASQWVVHRDPRWWPQPERFDPWRWVADGGPRAADGGAERPRLAYFPFGAGPRMCVGEQFAWQEGVIALATMARRWRFERVPGQVPTPDPRITLRPRGGVWLRATPR